MFYSNADSTQLAQIMNEQQRIMEVQQEMSVLLEQLAWNMAKAEKQERRKPS